MAPKSNNERDELAREKRVFVQSDNVFQRRARLLQALWREEQQLPIGSHRGQPMGSKLEMPFAEEKLANYHTERVRKVFRRELSRPEKNRYKLYSKTKIFDDLLSSQSLVFNLFGELASDLDLASEVISDLLPGEPKRVSELRIRYSPGRSDDSFTADNTLFDVFISYLTGDDRKGGLGIAVKYHEDMTEKVYSLKPRYDEIAASMNIFKNKEHKTLRSQRGVQQLWRVHLLLGSMANQGLLDEYHSIFAYPQGNTRCEKIATEYEGCLHKKETFHQWTLEEIAKTIQKHCDEPWVRQFSARYLDFSKLPGGTQALPKEQLDICRRFLENRMRYLRGRSEPQKVIESRKHKIAALKRVNSALRRVKKDVKRLDTSLLDVLKEVQILAQDKSNKMQETFGGGHVHHHIERMSGLRPLLQEEDIQPPGTINTDATDYLDPTVLTPLINMGFASREETVSPRSNAIQWLTELQQILYKWIRRIEIDSSRIVLADPDAETQFFFPTKKRKEKYRPPDLEWQIFADALVEIELKTGQEVDPTQIALKLFEFAEQIEVKSSEDGEFCRENPLKDREPQDLGKFREAINRHLKLARDRHLKVGNAIAE